MAIEGKRSGSSGASLSDENDLSEAVLDGVVGGTAGPTSGQKTKGGHELSEVTSLLHDAASLSVLQGQLEKLEKGGHGQPTKAEQTLHTAIDALVSKDATTLTDLSSKLSAQQIGALANDYLHIGSKATDAQITKMADGLVQHGTQSHGGGSDIASYLHDAANSSVLQGQLDKMDGGGAHGVVSPSQQALQSALGMIADKDGTTLGDLSAKLDANQLGTLLDDADKMNAKTTDAEIQKMAQAIDKGATVHAGSGDLGQGWSAIKNLGNLDPSKLS